MDRLEKRSPAYSEQSVENFIKAAQYIVRLTAQQDILEALGKIIINYFHADWVAFARQNLDGEISLYKETGFGQAGSALLTTEKLRDTIREVLNTGFLASETIVLAEPYAAAFIPLPESAQTRTVLIVAHGQCSPPSAELLNLYLALAGIAGSTMARIATEQELRIQQGHLEALLKERTGERLRLESVLDMLPVYVMLLTSDYRVSFANRFFKERFGEGGDAPCFEYLFGQSEPCSFCEAAAVLRNDQPRHGVRRGPDGRFYDIFDFPFTDTDSSVLVMEVGIDISEQKAAEQEVRDLNVELERVLDRTAALAETNKELEAFTYSVSHDLRAPLRAIDGFSKMLVRDHETKLDEEGKRKLDIIRSNAQRMGQLIDDLLSLSRLGHRAMSHCAIEMKDLAEEVWKELSVLNPGINVKLRFGPSPCAYGDRILVKQVIFNLLSNAIKFTAARRDGVVEIGGCGKENEALFYVKDNGVGFDMQYYDKLFGIFQRLHDPREYDGMGVGLAIVQRVIHRHGGRVWAEGKVGEGAVFYFTLPEKR